MIESPSNRTKHLAIRVSPQDYERLMALARQDLKPLREWCREKILEALRPLNPSPWQSALLAEIVATEEMLVGMLCAIGRDGKLTAQKAQEIVDAAHNHKYRDVAALFQYAQSRADGHKSLKHRERNSKGAPSDES